jgi:hypothetical protein
LCQFYTSHPEDNRATTIQELEALLKEVDTLASHLKEREWGHDWQPSYDAVLLKVQALMEKIGLQGLVKPAFVLTAERMERPQVEEGSNVSSRICHIP